MVWAQIDKRHGTGTSKVTSFHPQWDAKCQPHHWRPEEIYDYIAYTKFTFPALQELVQSHWLQSQTPQAEPTCTAHEFRRHCWFQLTETPLSFWASQCPSLLFSYPSSSFYCSPQEVSCTFQIQTLFDCLSPFLSKGKEITLLSLSFWLRPFLRSKRGGNSLCKAALWPWRVIVVWAAYFTAYLTTDRSESFS